MIAETQNEASTKMQQAVEHAREDLATIRTGRAHPAMFNKITADYYGAPTPLQQLATFTSPDPRSMVITPFDRSAIGAIERAAQRAFDQGVWRLRDLKLLLEEPSPQLPLAFLESHPLIRDLDQYADLTPDCFTDP